MNQTAQNTLAQSSTSSKRHTLSLNVTAPVFSLTDIFGRKVDLGAYRGKKVFIAFFRHAGCPFCNLRVHFLQKHYDELKDKGLEMIFFFESKERVLLSSIFHKEVSPIPLIADPDKVWYETYGIEQSMRKFMKSHLTSFIQTVIKARKEDVPMGLMSGGASMSTMPAEFLLDENLIIRRLHYYRGLNDRMSMEHIHDFVGGKG